MPVERFSVGVLVFLCLRKCILLLVVVVLVGVVGGGVDLPVEAVINEVSGGSLSFMEWWREIGCHLTRRALSIDMFAEAANLRYQYSTGSLSVHALRRCNRLQAAKWAHKIWGPTGNSKN